MHALVGCDANASSTKVAPPHRDRHENRWIPVADLSTLCGVECAPRRPSERLHGANALALTRFRIDVLPLYRMTANGWAAARRRHGLKESLVLLGSPR